MSDKIEKRDKGTGLVKPSGAPNLAVMQKKRKEITPASDKIKLKTQVKGKAKTGVSLQVVFMFDITGSTFEYFEIIRRKLQEIVEAVKKESSGSQFAVFAFRNHGDEGRFSQIYYISPLTGNLEEIQAYIAQIDKGGGGGDALTCMEECLHEANLLLWDANAPKAVVIIGDMPPHGVIDHVSKCTGGLDYTLELNGLKEKEVKIYSVFCPTHRNERIYSFYQSLAEQGKGKFMEISEIEVLKELLIGICLKETGNFDKFEQRLQVLKSLSDPQKKKLLALKA